MAPNAHLLNLRVLNSRGTGTVSGVLAALDWVMANRATYNIRVVNLSLGTPAVDSYRDDPLCRAANTFGTINRHDDTVATYSSRGPTRSFWTDAAGVKRYDNVVKPDLVAPGNKIAGAEAVRNLLLENNPELDLGVSTDPTSKMIR